MSPTLDVVLVATSLLLAVVTGLWAVLDRPVPLWQLVATAVTEVVVLAVVGVAIAHLVSGHGPAGAVIVVGYLIAMPLVLPFGVLCALVERTRYGSVILAVTALTITVLVFRLRQLFGVHSG